MPESRRFLIVDDHAVVRRGVMYLLAEAYPGTVLVEAQSGKELMSQLRQQTFDIVLLDINMPDFSGLELLKDIGVEYPHTPVLILSGHSEDQYAVRVIKAGARGYLNKEAAPEELIMAVRKVLGGGKYISAALAEKLASHLVVDRDKPPHELLSDREYQVLTLIASGKTPTEIAEALALSVKTISTFRSRILGKLDMNTSAELTHYALRHGLVD